MYTIKYVVKAGDSIYSIARKFNVDMNEIFSINNLSNSNISIGQILEIPMENYIVKAGESLYTISKKLNVPIESLMILNNLESTNLDIGQVLKVPYYSEIIVDVDVANIRLGPSMKFDIMQQVIRGAKLPVMAIDEEWTKIELFDGRNGFIKNNLGNLKAYGKEKPISAILGYYSLEEGVALPSSYDSFIENKNELTEVPMFMFRISGDDPTTIEKFGNFTNKYVENVIEIGHRSNVKMLALIHNLLYTGGVAKAKEVTTAMLSSKESRAAFIENTIELVEGYGFDGVNIDIEDVEIEDSNKLTSFFKELAEALSKRGYYLSASVPSRVSDEDFNPFSDPFDYGEIGKVVDEFDVMLYNEHGWPGSGPGPVVSIGWMERVLRYAITKMPRSKIMAAVSVFGFDFNLDTEKNSYVTFDSAMNLANKYNKEIIFDPQTKTPYFKYIDEEGNNHEVWFENNESIKAKIDLASSLGIKGVALWRLGMEDESMWNMVREDVVVKRF
ncbi:MAG: glycosyl hydrolase family 18 protein [Senegalia sp. (in: firmicutes)]|uniref:glycosyl hydrolase family 18 protein n=1 Tax=Senegalia sp. (in: firmicutes) TaxID=1924098 RepID=UPI003F973218